ncbi:MAG: hypothetical protein JHC33_13500 [Ignisphaera sp.]|nr:hypothetical protein [Ignisphaera sp.]
MFIRLGVATSADFEKDMAAPLTKLEAKIRSFHDSTQFKDSFFSKLSNDGKMLDKLIPDVARFTISMVTLGQASKGGEDGGKLYQNMGMLGKLLVNMTPNMKNAEAATWGIGKALQTAFSTGILLVITGIITALAFLGQGLKTIALAGIKFQDELNKLNVLMGGLARDRINTFNASLNNTFKELTHLGVGVGTVLESMAGFISGGLNPAIAFQGHLIETSVKLAKITGESAQAMSGFFASIMVGSKVSGDNLRVLGDSWTKMNRVAEASGILASTSFNDVKEAITSVGSALLIASNRGSEFTDKLSKDLVSLTTLSKTLGLAVGSINSKFEESANLLSNPDSGFRALLAISGGANVSQMLSNNFDRTEAMLKVAGTLERLNKSLGGNLNLMAQVAQQSFGVSKEEAIRLATMTEQQKNAIAQAQRDAAKMKADGITDAYNSITGTLSETWEKFKNVMMMTFQRAFAGNNGLQSFLGKVTDKLQEWIDGFGDPNSPAQKFVDKLSDAITWISDKLGKLFDNLVPLLERFGKWAGELLQNISDGKFKAAVGQFFGDIFVSGLKYAFKAVFTDPTIYGSILGAITGFLLVPYTGGLSMLLGPVIGGAIGHLFGNPSDNSSPSASSNSSPDQRKNDLAPLTGQLREYLDQNRKDQARYAGLKDTDVVLGRDGNISLAGLEKIKLEEKEDALLKAQKDLSDSTQDLNITMKEAIIAISNMNGTPEAKAEADKKIQALEADRNATLPVRVRDAVGNEAMFVR